MEKEEKSEVYYYLKYLNSDELVKLINNKYKRNNINSDNETGINELKEPPIGLIPKYIHDTKRFRDVCEAIVRYYENNMKIPIEWVEEYNEMIERIHK